MHLHAERAILRPPQRDSWNALMGTVGRDEDEATGIDIGHPRNPAYRAGDGFRDLDVVQKRSLHLMTGDERAA